MRYIGSASVGDDPAFGGVQLNTATADTDEMMVMSACRVLHQLPTARTAGGELGLILDQKRLCSLPADDLATTISYLMVGSAAVLILGMENWRTGLIGSGWRSSKGSRIPTAPAPCAAGMRFHEGEVAFEVNMAHQCVWTDRGEL